MVRRKRKRRYTRRRKLFKFRLKKNTVYTIAAIILFAAAGLSVLALRNGQSLLQHLRVIIEAYIGWGVYLLPVLLTSFALLFLRLKFRFTKPNVSFGLFLTFAALLGLTKAGVLGELLFVNVASILSAPGAYLLFFLTAVAGLMILFNTSLDKVILWAANTASFLTEIFNKHIVGDLAKLFERKEPSFSEQPGEMKIRGDGSDKDAESATESERLPETLEPAGSGRSNYVPSRAPAAVSGKGEDVLENEVLTNLEELDISKWEYPPLSLLDEISDTKADTGNIKDNADTIEKTLKSFGVKANVSEVNIGPAVTQYALHIAMGTKLSKITALSNDLALALAAPTGQIRIEAPIPGRSLVGIEVPNRSLKFVTLRKMLSTKLMREAESPLTVGLGLDVAGNAVTTNIARMPHVLIAGTTGAGKSVLLNAWIASLLYRTTPAEIRLMLVDPKRVELTIYNGIPHLLTEVIVDPKEIVSALRWATGEMDRRYKEFARLRARNIDAYNEEAGYQAMPHLVIVIDELADLMAFAPAEVEDSVTRIAQMARATGIHLIIATQRPSVDVITGLMKANIPCRIAFNVSSSVDSRVILDQTGAEKLLGRGDMLYIPPDQAKPKRIQGVFVSDKEIRKLVDFLKKSEVEVEYTDEVKEEPINVRSDGKVVGFAADDRDELFNDALRLVCSADKASASMLQRKLSVGYARAARILDQLHEAGVVGPSEGPKARDVLIRNPEQFYAKEQSKVVTAPPPAAS